MIARNLLAAVLCLSTSLGLAPTASLAEGPDPVLMVISNQDFYYRDYADTRASLASQGLDVVVAAATTQTAMPHGEYSRAPVSPDLALADVKAEDYSAIVFVGGWGASSYQYAFEGTYHNTAYRRDPQVVEAVNDLVTDFARQNKPVAAICHGVSVLAWARVDGASPIAGRHVAGFAAGGPGFELNGERYADAALAMSWHVEKNGGVFGPAASAGDPHTATDDVIVDGNIITAENYRSARLFGQVIAYTVNER